MSACLYVDFKNKTSNINLPNELTKLQGQLLKDIYFFIFVTEVVAMVMVLVMVTDDYTVKKLGNDLLGLSQIVVIVLRPMLTTCPS